MPSLQSALLAADEAFLTGMSNKGLYKRAVKDLQTAEGSVTYVGDTAVVSICGETCTLRDPLPESTCSCPSRSTCRHILTAILWLRPQVQADAPEAPAPEPEAVPEPPAPETPAPAPTPEPEPALPASVKDASQIRECAMQGLALLADVLLWGLVRLPEAMAEHLEAAAVRSHAYRMADAERMLRDLGTSLKNCRERRAVFRSEQFLYKLARTASHLQTLCGETVTEEMLGAFRRTYENYPRDLRLLPVGQREVAGDEYEGTIYYFLNLDTDADRRFLVYSDLRPVFYDTVRTWKSSFAPWNAGMPMEKLMRRQITLIGAKLSGDKISASQDTQIVSMLNANLNCWEVHDLLQKHFRKIALEISGKTEETERMYFLCPKQCLASGFDTHAQQFRMRMQDADGCCAEFRVRYRKESKDFIEELEHIGRHMTEHPEQVCYYDYVWLCTAAFEDGELVFFPIEVYDFIETYAAPDWTAPPDMPDSVHVPQIAALFAEVSDWLCELVQSGVRSAPDGRGKELSHKADRCGMTGLSGMITALAEQAEQYRHSLHTDASGALAALVQLQHYLETGREKLAVLSALQQMQPES